MDANWYCPLYFVGAKHVVKSLCDLVELCDIWLSVIELIVDAYFPGDMSQIFRRGNTTYVRCTPWQ
jgi:hypothetical protein